MPTNLVSRTGKTVTVADPAEAAQYIEAGWRPESTEEAIVRDTEARRAEDTPASASFALGVLSSGSGGLTDAFARVIGGKEGARQVRETKEAHPTAALAGEVVGGVGATVAGVGPLGKAAQLGQRIARAGEGASAVAQLGRAALGAGVEGAAMGLGTGVTELAQSAEPLSVERAVSTLSSHALYGLAIGGAAGTVGKSLEIGLQKGKVAIEEAAAQSAKAATISDDLARLDAKGLRAAETAERETLEAARVTQRQELADELVSFRRELKQQKQFLTTKDVELAAVGEKLGSKELGRIAAKANKQLDNILDNPVGLAKNPAKALDALQRQENALAKLSERSDELRTMFAADTSGARMAALDSVAPALERNRALQAKISDLAGELKSPRLEQIAAARDTLATRGTEKSLAEKMAGGSVFSAVTGGLSALPIPGAGFLAPMLGAKAASFVGEKVFGRLGAAMSAGEARAANAISKVFEAGARGAKASPPLASRVLGSVAFAPPRTTPKDAGPAPRERLPDVFRRRADELREQVATGPTGAPMVRPEVRARIASTFDGIGAIHPQLADRMETLAVKRLEFLASKLPKRPDLGVMSMGPDHWQPSDMEMRRWARFVAAAEDPDGILERVSTGQVSPEDGEVMRELYPEMLADVTRQVLEKLPELRAALPRDRRIALSVLTGVPVDPSLSPHILRITQSQFSVDVQPPRAAPQFGSVKNHELGTASERREQGS